MAGPIEIGDRAYYPGRDGYSIVGGIVAEIATSPLTGNRRFRIVDSWRDKEDPDAGRWIPVENLIGAYPPDPDVKDS